MQPKKEREKRVYQNLDKTLANIEKTYGKHAIIKMGDDWTEKGVEVIPSGSIALDRALGVWGYPRGRIVEIFGQEMSGKTTLALQAIAEAQRIGQVAAFIDAEHAFDALYATGIGVNVSELYMSQPDTGEQGLDIVEQLTGSGDVGIIVVDSVAALVPEAEIDGAMGQAHMGLQARLMSQALRKLTGIVAKTKTCLIFINQLRQKIGIVFGNPNVTTGGTALKFYSSVRIEVLKQQSIKDDAGEQMGNHVRAKVCKNKLAPPHREAEFDILFGVGIDQISDLISMATMTGIIEKQGMWFSYNGNRLGQGIDACREVVKDATLFEEIKTKVMEAIR